jgi:hypothetical protein
VLLRIKMNIYFSDIIEQEMNGESDANEFPSISEEVSNAYFQMLFESLISDFHLHFCMTCFSAISSTSSGAPC